MYSACLFCNGYLGRNDVLPTFPVGARIAYDPLRGRLWVICQSCQRWNLTPLDERWEAIEECERRVRNTRLRYSTDNIGLAFLPEGLALVRIGPALKPEIAAWRYGRYLPTWLPATRTGPVVQLARRLKDRTTELIDRVAHRALGKPAGFETAVWLRLHVERNRILAWVAPAGCASSPIRVRHLERSELIRPDPSEPWQLAVAYDGGFASLSGDPGLRVAGRLLAFLNGPGAADAEVRYAIAKLDDAGNPDGYFARVAAIAMRTRWGKAPNALALLPAEVPEASVSERLALHLTKRSFWGRGGIGAEPSTALPRLPLADRLALEMAANEDAERRALEGELAMLEAAWREAEEIAGIADNLFLEKGDGAETKREAHTSGKRAQSSDRGPLLARPT
ncbi:MAG: hypothetical protein ABI647_09850 [Gemmatimonadota bacterium]